MKFLNKFLPASIVAATFLALPAFARAPVAGTVVSLAGWKWKAVAENMDRIKNAGYTAILLSPHTATCSGGFGGMGYDPSDLTSFHGGFGDEGQLAHLIRTAHARGIQVYADMIMNHMCAKADRNYPRFSQQDFHSHGQIDNWQDPWQVENGDLFGLHDLAHESAYVRGELWNYLVKTNNLGFDGYRWDAAKHVPRWYWADHVVNNVRSWGKFSFGEVYDAKTDILQSYADTGMSVTDYKLYDAIQRAFRFGGDLRELDGAGFSMINGPKSVTFVENHDVGAPPNRHLAYAFIAAYPGYPLFANVDIGDKKISNLAWIHTNLAAGAYINRWSERDVLIFERQGYLLAAINQTNHWQHRWVQTSWNGMRLNDYTGHSGAKHTEWDGRVEVSIPPMSYVMLAP